MATCKDCFNYDLCKARGMRSVEILDCTYFKDKSKIIKLPCKVGDMVYMVVIERVIPIKVNDIDIKKNFLTNDFDIILLCEGIFDGMKCNLTITWKKRYRKDIFLTKEEAEKALKELENG